MSTECLASRSAGWGAAYIRGVTVTLELPDDVVERLRAEALRRGVTLESLVGELAAGLPAGDALEAFIGSGASGRRDSFDIKRERAALAHVSAPRPRRLDTRSDLRRHRRVRVGSRPR